MRKSALILALSAAAIYGAVWAGVWTVLAPFLP
jgi:hypothetical protein